MTLHGLEADRHLLQCVFSSVDFTETSSKISVPSPQNQLLLDQCTALLNKPSVLTSICYITDNPLNKTKVGVERCIIIIDHNNTLSDNTLGHCTFLEIIPYHVRKFDPTRTALVCFALITISKEIEAQK